VTLRLPDVSHYQGAIDWAKVGPAAIIKACESTTVVDDRFAHNAGGAIAHCQWWGAYQFLRATDNPKTAAQFFKKTLGKLRPNVVVLDLEVGSGDQYARRQAWLAEMADFPAAKWTYTGLAFESEHHLGTVEWVAAYRALEPAGNHLLWQYTSAGTWPGIQGRCDLSLYHGDIHDLIAATALAPKPSGLPPTLKPGGPAHPSWVSHLQKLLRLPVNGHYGPRTQLAVRVYRLKHGMVPSRTVGPKVWAHLGLWP
jgi:peptidoglycan hydrolase-like protein with peptidoglycan-binding domain